MSDREDGARRRALAAVLAASDGLAAHRHTRADAIEAAIEAGVTVTEIAARLGVTRGTIYRWLDND